MESLIIMIVDLIWLGESAPDWSLGQAWAVNSSVKAVHDWIQTHIATTAATHWLFWDAALGTPGEICIQKLLALPGDLWHGGLRLGTTGQPGLLDFVTPTWMLNRDPAPDSEATSWRLSLRACLLSVEVI